MREREGLLGLGKRCVGRIRVFDPIRVRKSVYEGTQLGLVGGGGVNLLLKEPLVADAMIVVAIIWITGDLVIKMRSSGRDEKAKRKKE